MARLSSSALNNEFFTHASQSWKERLAEGKCFLGRGYWFEKKKHGPYRNSVLTIVASKGNQRIMRKGEPKICPNISCIIYTSA